MCRGTTWPNNRMQLTVSAPATGTAAPAADAECSPVTVANNEGNRKGTDSRWWVSAGLPRSGSMGASRSSLSRRPDGAESLAWC